MEGLQSQTITQVAKQSFVVGWQQAMWVGACAMCVLLVHVLLPDHKTIRFNEKPGKTNPHTKIEVFTTNVPTETQANTVIATLQKQFPSLKINFDIEEALTTIVVAIVFSELKVDTRQLITL